MTARCSPTRAQLLTGRYHPRGGVYGTSAKAERLDLDERTIAETFRAAGYATGAFGKWHNGRRVQGKGYLADDLTDRALAFIERNRSRPFFCYIPYNTPHSPMQVPDRFYQKFAKADLPIRYRDRPPADPCRSGRYPGRRDKGRGPLTIRAVEIPGRQAIEISALVLSRR